MEGKPLLALPLNLGAVRVKTQAWRCNDRRREEFTTTLETGCNQGAFHHPLGTRIST